MNGSNKLAGLIAVFLIGAAMAMGVRIHQTWPDEPVWLNHPHFKGRIDK